MADQDTVDPGTGVSRADETAWYAKLFALADADRDGKIGGAEAANFLRKTGLDNHQLEQVWDTVDVSKSGKLGPREFAQALRVVAAVQQGKPLALSSMAQISALAQFPKDPSIPAAPARGGGVMPLTDADREKYDRLFGDADVDKDGFVSGSEAQTYFSKGNLQRQQLAKVWELSERDGDKKLSPAEFRVAMHLVYVALKTGKLPEELTDEVYASSKVGLAAPQPVQRPAMPSGPSFGVGMPLAYGAGAGAPAATGFGGAMAGGPVLGVGSMGFGASPFGEAGPTGAFGPQGFKKPHEIAKQQQGQSEPAAPSGFGAASGFGGDGFSAAPTFVPDGQQPTFAGGNVSNAAADQQHLIAQHTLPGMSFEGRLELQGALQQAAQRPGHN